MPLEIMIIYSPDSDVDDILLLDLEYKWSYSAKPLEKWYENILAFSHALRHINDATNTIPALYQS